MEYFLIAFATIKIVLAIIFCFIKVLKNTFLTALKKASNNDVARTYYPATVLLGVNYNSDFEGVSADFSMYEERRIVGLLVDTKQNYKERTEKMGLSYNEEDEPENDFSFTIIPNAYVYEEVPGVWSWTESLF